MIEPLEALKDKMVMVAKVLQHQGVIDGYGHITARLPKITYSARRICRREKSPCGT